MDNRAVNPDHPNFLTRSIGVCENTDVPGTSSRRTQLFTFQGALSGQTISGPAVCRVEPRARRGLYADPRPCQGLRKAREHGF
jgi:hypothetical protein